MTRVFMGSSVCALAIVIACPAFAQTGSPAQGGSAQTDPTAANVPVNADKGAKPAGTPTAEKDSGYPAEAEGYGATTGGYNISRWAEDWSKYKDPAKRDDPLDSLKYISIDSGSNSYLTLSGEIRARVNFTSNQGLVETDAQRLDILRVVGGADLHLGDHFRVFGELANGTVGGVNTGAVAGTQRNDLFLQQAFADVYGKVGNVEVGVRGGRQEFTDGISLLVSARDNNAVMFVLDGVRAWAKGKTLRADVFDFNFVNYGTEGLSDDKTDKDTRFSGISLGVVLPEKLFGGSKLFFDPLLWRLRSRDQIWGQRRGVEERIYYGGRLWGTAGPLTVDYTVTREEGNFNGRPIKAWQVFAAQTYRLGKDKSAPRVGLRGDYGSGGDAFDPTKPLRTSFSPFGNNIYYTYGVFVGPINYIDAAPNVSFQPIAKVRVTAEYEFMWRATLNDAVYRSNGTPYLGTQNVGGREIGQAARLQAVWSITPRLSFTGRLEHFKAGDALTNAGYKGTNFGAGWLSFRF
ncbi:alginate export family protein [Sphingomonas sp. HMP9]|uniref:alginate export family protein n=1 Tax=Sphingomonas sp. HMP9 TaxID=1517554 RepID=UPI001E5FDA4A|nr:alginate export family protein [Sphingomonas sp. HMP9]